MATKNLIDEYTSKKKADDEAASGVATAATTKTHTTADVQSAATALSADLQANGPAVDLGSESPPIVTYYAFAPTDPGFTATVVRIA